MDTTDTKINPSALETKETNQRVNLLDFDRASMRDYFVSVGEKAFRGDQITQWIHQYGYRTFEGMTNLSRTLRAHLTDKVCVTPPSIVRDDLSKDGTRKWLVQFEDGACVEMVFIPESGRGTLCISSQVGCAMKCTFCATGTLGFKRNLKVSEIIGQVWLAVRLLSKDEGRHDQTITNVVLMGMGEPLLNLDNVVKATNIMTDDLAYGLSKYRVTLSTAGVVPAMDRLSEVSDISLAVSLHAPNDALRSKLMLINKKYPLTELIPACRRFFKKESKRLIAIEYILIKGVNDKVSHAKELVNLLQGVRCKINLIPYNEAAGLGFEKPDLTTIDAFRQVLVRAGFTTITRKTRGDDIGAACGQLAAKEREVRIGGLKD